MLRRRIVPLSVLMFLGVGAVLAGCSSTTTSSTSTTTAGGGVSATTAPATSPSGSTPAAANSISVTLNDTNGLNGPMTMVVSPTTAKAGQVTFTVTNKGTITHEMVVLKLEANQTWNSLTVTADKVSEDGSKGETGDVAAGETKTVQLNLDAGNYALVCNVEKHYAMGMRSPFTVT